ncbi:MAG: hypothetical protein WCP19_04730, partial [Chloroflexota bacterium]
MMVSKLPKNDSNDEKDDQTKDINNGSSTAGKPEDQSEEDSIELLRNLIFSNSNSIENTVSQQPIVPYGTDQGTMIAKTVLPQFEDEDFLNPVEITEEKKAGSFNPFVDESEGSPNTQPFDPNGNINDPVIIPPFVVENSAEQKDTYSHSLAENIKNGSVPAESIRIMISSVMTDSEIIPIAKAMGINWKLTPGEDTDEKIQFLIDYFNRVHHRESISAKSDQIETEIPTVEFSDDWIDSENRMQELKESLDFPEITPEEIKYPFFIHLDGGKMHKWQNFTDISDN